ncbi:hypothetical protein BC829DRAFT_378718 [Chytridium lagenaria]|nr:hypothetical protein BC829DRAFT_378718 [Chytridium lagenaria]
MALTASQTSAVVTRAKHLGASVTGLLLSSAAVAIAPLTDSKSPQHTREGTGWSLLSWLGGIFPTASSIHHSTSSEPTSTTQLIRTPPQNYVPLLSGLAVDARPALGIAPHIGGSFNTVMLAAIPSTLVVPLGSTPADIFKASDKNAPLLTNTLRQATTPRIGYAWRYGMLLSDDRQSHPDPGALKAMSFPNEPGSENPNATDGDSVVDEHPPFMAFTMSNLGRMGMEDAEGKDAWVKEVWLTSTARAMSSSGQVQWSNVTVGGVMRFIFSWVDGSLDENMIKEIATRLGLALCGEAVEIA